MSKLIINFGIEFSSPDNILTITAHSEKSKRVATVTTTDALIEDGRIIVDKFVLKSMLIELENELGVE